ncbi:MAG: hypothetical protein R3B55_02070 [Candidatus Paceibacterota bacterium]
MLGFVHKLRQKPEDVRNKFAIIFAMSLTLLIVGIWMLFLRSGKTEKDIVEKSTGEDLKPLMMIFGGAKDKFKELKKDISNKNQEN